MHKECQKAQSVQEVECSVSSLSLTGVLLKFNNVINIYNIQYKKRFLKLLRTIIDHSNTHEAGLDTNRQKINISII